MYRNKEVELRLVGVIEWFTRSNGITPGQSEYPVDYLKKRNDTIKLLIDYYETRLKTNELFVNDNNLSRKNYW